MISHQGHAKELVGKQLGLWSGTSDCYYNFPRKWIYLGHKWESDETHLVHLLAAALWLARQTSRSLLTPSTVAYLGVDANNTKASYTMAFTCAYNQSKLKHMPVSLLDANYVYFKRHFKKRLSHNHSVPHNVAIHAEGTNVSVTDFHVPSPLPTHWLQQLRNIGTQGINIFQAQILFSQHNNKEFADLTVPFAHGQCMT